MASAPQQDQEENQSETYQVMYRRYRPKTFGKILGQGHIADPLREQIVNNRVSQTNLFVGPRGTGKTTTARVLAKALNCENTINGEPCNSCTSCISVDSNNGNSGFYEFDAGMNSGVGDIRSLLQLTATSSFTTKNKVFLIDEVHQMTSHASTAFLKTLEDTPSNVYFILCTTDSDRLIDTITSRSTRWNFRLLDEGTLSGHVREIAEREGQMELTDDQVSSVIEEGNGSVRDTLSTLERLLGGGEVQSKDFTVMIMDALVEASIPDLYSAIAEANDEGVHPSSLAISLTRYVRNATLALHAPNLLTVQGLKREALLEHADELRMARLNRLSTLLSSATTSMASSIDSRFVLEHHLVSFIAPEGADKDMQEILNRLEELQETIEALSVAPSVVSATSTSESSESAKSAPEAAESVWDSSQSKKRDDSNWPDTEDADEDGNDEPEEEAPAEEVPEVEESVEPDHFTEAEIDDVISDLAEILESSRRTQTFANTFSSKCSGAYIDPEDPRILALTIDIELTEKQEYMLGSAISELRKQNEYPKNKRIELEF